MTSALHQYYYGDQVKDDEIGGSCSTHWQGKKPYRTLVGKPEGKIPRGRPRRRWEDAIRMVLREKE
jgi:hypothetical protein